MANGDIPPHTLSSCPSPYASGFLAMHVCLNIQMTGPGTMLFSPRGHKARKKQMVAEPQGTGLQGWYFTLI